MAVLRFKGARVVVVASVAVSVASVAVLVGGMAVVVGGTAVVTTGFLVVGGAVVTGTVVGLSWGL